MLSVLLVLLSASFVPCDAVKRRKPRAQREHRESKTGSHAHSDPPPPPPPPPQATQTSAKVKGMGAAGPGARAVSLEEGLELQTNAVTAAFGGEGW